MAEANWQEIFIFLSSSVSSILDEYAPRESLYDSHCADFVHVRDCARVCKVHKAWSCKNGSPCSYYLVPCRRNGLVFVSVFLFAVFAANLSRFLIHSLRRVWIFDGTADYIFGECGRSEPLV